MKRTFIVLPVVVALVAVVALLGATSPAEAQSRGKPLPQFVPKHEQEHFQRQMEQAEDNIKTAKEVQKRGKHLQKFVEEGAEGLSKDLLKEEAKKRSAKREYEELLNEAEKTKREVERSFFERLKEHFSCFADQLAGEEECRKDKKDKKEPHSDRGGGQNGPCPPGTRLIGAYLGPNSSLGSWACV